MLSLLYLDFSFKSCNVRAVKPTFLSFSVSMSNGRNSARWENFVSETVTEEGWRKNFFMCRRSLYKLADELRVHRGTSVWTGKFGLNTDTCGGDSQYPDTCG